MQDMLVRLLDLPEYHPGSFKGGDVRIKRAISPERHVVTDWVGKHFSNAWKSECFTAFSTTPTNCFVAYKENEIAGFACYETTAKNFFGPTGVLDKFQGLGIGKALLLEALYAMRSEGYVYAIIGGVGPADFYLKAVGAQLIEKSGPGVYKDLLKEHKE